MKVLVSACIMGSNCKYNGKNNVNIRAINFLKDKEVISICPEVLAGMKIPRPCAEIVIKQYQSHYRKFKMKILTSLYCNPEVRLVGSIRYMMVALLGN